MVKTMTAMTLQTENVVRARRDKQSAGLTFLIVKNLLFWGSVGLSCYGIYSLIAYLVG
jgi:hypothetical protein